MVLFETKRPGYNEFMNESCTCLGDGASYKGVIIGITR